MYKIVNMKERAGKSGLESVELYEGETIEAKVDRVVNNKEAIKDGAPIIYEENRDGVNPAHDIRTDGFEIAIEAMDVGNRAKAAQRANKPKMEVTKKPNENIEATGTEGE